jgi:predicted flavoprotein YhiN
VPRLYFAGEVLDIDGITGGFNFQAAWTTAYVVQQSIKTAADAINAGVLRY